MDFLLTDIHTDLAETVDQILERAGGSAAARSWADNGDTSTAFSVYRSLAEAGITGLLTPDELGGSGAGASEMVVAVERIGRLALPGPIAETFAVLPFALADAAATDALEELLSGSPATCALAPLQPRAANPDVATPYAIVDGAIWTSTPGELLESVDPTRRVAALTADDKLGTVDTMRAADLGALATAAEFIGLGSAMLDIAADYAKTRKQFGREIGSFQAVKHHLADVAIAIEMARPLVLGAAVGVDGFAPEDTNVRRDVAAAKVAAGDAAHLAARNALQVLGAIGYTAEHDLSLYLTKTRALLSSWGTSAHHRATVLETL